MKQLNNKNINNDEYLIKIKASLFRRYSDDIQNKYNLLIITSILSNRNTHLVTRFKDFLLYDDYSEFLKRFYRRKESSTRLKRISNFFKETSVLYPNYSSLIESKYIYSNIIKKQMIIFKQEKYKKNNKIYKFKKHYLEKSDSMNKIENIFFNSTIYNDILNESESFMNILFGIEKKNKNSKTKNNEGEKFVDELIKIIDMIENNEKKCDDIDFNKIEMDKNSYMKKDEITDNICRRNERILNYEHITDITDKFYYSNSSMQNKYEKKIKNINKIEKTNKLYSDKNNTENNNNNEASKENNNYINSQNNKNLKSPKERKSVYHRKVKSTLIGDYLNKLELPSNSNVVNMLKIANETYADNANKNNMRCILYKTMRNMNNGIEMRKHMNQMINIPQSIQNRIKNSKNNIKLDNNKDSIYKLEKNASQKESNNNLLKKGKIENNSPKRMGSKYCKINNYVGIKKRNVPMTTRNCNSIVSLYEKANKKSVNSINKNNVNLFNSLNNLSSNTFAYNPVFNSCKKPENGFKSIFANSNITGPYSKPKCFDKKKYKGVSVKKLFNKSDEILENEKEEKMN